MTNNQDFIEPLHFCSESDNIKAFTMLRGKVDALSYYSHWNLCDYTGDSAEHIHLCRTHLCQTLGIGLDRLIMPRQTHSVNIAVIDDVFLSSDTELRRKALKGVDALVTLCRGIVIGVNTADCVPVALFDPVTGCTAVAHAGWRGTVGKIVSRTVEQMTKLGADPKNIQAAIGVSICAECFEVGDEVVEAFAKEGFPMNDIETRAIGGKAHLNLQEANRFLLKEAGLQPDHIALSGKCSRCNPDKYFSARRIGINSGRTFTFIYSK